MNISANTTLQAIAYVSGMADSPITSGSYTIECAAPTFSPAAGSYGTAQSVTIGTTTGGATIRYTTNGTTPTETVGTVYSSAVNISANTTLQAIAYLSGMADSPISSGNYAIECAAPTFSPAAGTYSTAQNVTISTATGGATIRYTTDGTTPSETAGTLYSSAVNISANTPLQAIAYKGAWPTVRSVPAATPSHVPRRLSARQQATMVRAKCKHQHHHRRRNHPLYHGRQHAE